MTSGSGTRATVCCKSAESLRAFNLMKWLVALGLLALLLLCWLMGWCKAGWCPEGAVSPAPVAVAPAPVPAATAPVVPVPAPAALKAGSISTQWVDGKLRLSGLVGSAAEKARALEAAQQAFGADKVTDDLQVRDGYTALEWIELNGEAASESERAATEAAVRKAYGSNVRVDNRIVVKTAAVAAAAPAAAPAGSDCELATRQTLSFFLNSSALTIPDRAKLAAMLPCLKGRKFEIAGHTDNLGGEDHNQRLSQARATVARAWLIRHGMAAGDIKATGYGQSKPVAGNETVEGRRQNRRVEIVWQ